MAELFTIASAFETASVEDRNKLKDVVRGLVGYACKIACKENTGCIDIYVFSELRNRVTDWVEIQPSGAMGVIFDMYDDPDSKAVESCDNACCKYNDACNVSFEETDDDDASGDSCSS